MLRQISNMAKKGSQCREALFIFCQNANSNLNFNKTTQWNVTYYAVILFGAIDAFYFKFAKTLWLIVLLIFVANAIFLFGFYIALDI